MAKILPDSGIEKLLGTVLLEAEPELIRPNSIKLRLGNEVKFLSTDEVFDIPEGSFVRIHPGESVIIKSFETIDFSPETVKQHYADGALYGLISPTTTMMREGISQVTTVIDAGFRGQLNWGLHNGSARPFTLQHGEPIYKLTIFLLEEGEVPEKFYGERAGDNYQDQKGLIESKRQLPVNIPDSKIVTSSFDKIDATKQLKEAGHPFNYIGSELDKLQGKFEILERRVNGLSSKISEETQTLTTKIKESESSLRSHVELVFTKKSYQVAGMVTGAIVVLYSIVKFLCDREVKDSIVAGCALAIGIIIILLTLIITKDSSKSTK